MKSSIFELFEVYVNTYASTDAGCDRQSLVPFESNQYAFAIDNPTFAKGGSMLKEKFKKHKLESGLGRSKQYELEMYLSESIIEEDVSFDVLRWWKINSQRFPILSRMARDVLAVPISTAASESAFSTGGQVLDVFRSSLTPKLVEALICTQDWMRLSNNPISVEEALTDLENLETGLPHYYILLFQEL